MANNFGRGVWGLIWLIILLQCFPTARPKELKGNLIFFFLLCAAFLKNKPNTPTTKDVNDGSSLSLFCPEPFGYPEPFVAWVKDGVVLKNSSSCRFLNLTAVNQTYDGSAIDCIASNKHGADYHRFILKVKSK